MSMAAGFGIQQLAGQWVTGFGVAFNINPDGSGSGGSGAEGMGYETTTVRQRLLEKQREKYLAEMAMHMADEDEIILILLGDL